MAFIFCLLVFFLVVISIISKLILFIADSSFDGKHNFTVMLYESDIKNQNAQSKTMIVSFAPDIQSISVLEVRGDTKQSDLGKTLEIPIDGTMIFSHGDNFFNGQRDKIESMLQKAIFKRQDVNTKLTIIDLARLWFFTRSIPEQSIVSKELVLSPEGASPSEELIDKISSQFFVDYTLSTEKVSIQIINGTDVLGLGNRLARLVSNMGGNVVSVSTADKGLDTSEILYLENTYTLNRLSKILGFKTSKMTEMAISDITIKIGKDSLSSLVF